MPAFVPPAVVRLAFDPVVAFGGLAVRWETVGIAVAVLVALVVAALIARRTPIPGETAMLRADDLLFVAVGAAPGAVLGGRIGYVLLHLDYYRAAPAAILDPASGGFELSCAVGGGILAGLAVAAILDGGTRRWAHVAAVPLFLALGIGKLALALGGTGQGAPSDVAWATAYDGPGPWGSLAPAVASHPAQLYEAAGSFVIVVVLVALAAGGAFDRRDGRLLALGVVLWAILRAGVAVVWRDAPVLGLVRAEQLLSLAPLALGLASWVMFGRPFATPDDRAAGNPLHWPDPSIAERWRARADRR
ncbi:MAG TPA: prolipoprotein diacylglyceryl transferase family protein [Candidatus Limnocylindrales bacterium]|nr:prolipoprotein diacylglyceryl transferase family protein [Candidatus Limnocylindrales bacterium]